MSRRIEVELTSSRDDGVWTWRAAGAKQPKGELDGGLLYEGAAVGDVVRADAEFYLDGIEILTVLAPKRKREAKVETIEVIGSGRSEELVTTQLAKKGGGGGGKGGRGGRDRKGRGDRGDRDRGRNKRDDRGRPEGGRDDERGGRGRRDRGEGRERPQPEKDARPKPKRLRPKRVHRKALLDSLPAEQQAVAEQVLRGGLPAVRQALDKQNEEAKAEGRPEVNPDAILKMAEDLVPATRTAEWRDRAEAAVAEIDELDLRDIRSVINAAETAARDDETRALADQLRAGTRPSGRGGARQVAGRSHQRPGRRATRAGAASELASPQGRCAPSCRPQGTIEGHDRGGALQRDRPAAVRHRPRCVGLLPHPCRGRADGSTGEARRAAEGRRAEARRPDPADRCAVRHRTRTAHQKSREGSRQGQEEASSPAASHRRRGRIRRSDAARARGPPEPPPEAPAPEAAEPEAVAEPEVAAQPEPVASPSRPRARGSSSPG